MASAVVCSTLSSQGSDGSADPAADVDAQVSPVSSDQGSPDDDDNLEINVEHSGGKAGNSSVHGGTRTTKENEVCHVGFSPFDVCF